MADYSQPTYYNQLPPGTPLYSTDTPYVPFTGGAGQGVPMTGSTLGSSIGQGISGGFSSLGTSIHGNISTWWQNELPFLKKYSLSGVLILVIVLLAYKLVIQ